MRSTSSAFVIFLSLCLVSLSAEAQIFQPGTQPTGEPDGLTLPLQSSGSCGRCHAGYDDADDYEPYESWRGSLMGNALRDPIARAAIAIAEEDHPDAADFCVRCHSPPAWTRGRTRVPEFDMMAMPPTRFEPDTDILSDDLSGVTCMSCHRMVDPGDPAMVRNAQFVLADGAEGAARRGPYTYEPGFDPRHETAQEPYLSSGALCGTCHDISNPVVPGQRIGAGGALEPTGRDFAVERTYSEWLASAFPARGETCQTCHMPIVETAVRPADDGFPRDEMNRHDLTGGSVWVPLAIAASIESIDADAAAALRASSMRARDLLTRSARLEITTSSLAGDTASAAVTVTNLTGHKLPTGYPEGRRMWLEVLVEDSTGAVVASSGRFDSATSTLQEDDQLHTWEIHLGQGTTPSFHFIQNDLVLDDTRIPPEGFMPPESADMEPIGRDYSDGAGGYRNFDEANYSLAVCGSGQLTLRARLLYQSNTREYVEFLRDTAPPSADPALGGESWGDIAYRAWQEHGGMEAVLMAEATVMLGDAATPCPEPTPDAGPAVEDAGVRPDAGPDAPPAEDGCSCSAAGGRGALGWALVPVTFLALAFRARRRRRG